MNRPLGIYMFSHPVMFVVISKQQQFQIVSEKNKLPVNLLTKTTMSILVHECIKLHVCTKLHEDTFARRLTFARRHFSTSRQFCDEKLLHMLNFLCIHLLFQIISISYFFIFTITVTPCPYPRSVVLFFGFFFTFMQNCNSCKIDP